jgi:tetratricopeptide (TPR) repeat protein
MTASLRTCLAITYCLQGQHKQALPWIREALAHADRIGNKREQARAKGALGFYELATGGTELAAGHFAEVLKIGRELDDDWLSGMAPFYLGIIQHGQGRHQEAVDYLEQSLAIAEKIGNPRPISKTLAYFGGLLLDADRAEQAAQVLLRATNIAEDAGDIPLHTLCLARLGTARLRIGDTDGALALHERALAALTEQTSPDLLEEIHARLAESQQAVAR